MLDQNFFLDVNRIIFISFLFLSAAIVLSVFKKTVLNRKDFVKIAAACVILNLLSLLLSYKSIGMYQTIFAYGWPHEFYMVIISPDNTESRNLFTLPYLLSNIIFYLSITFLFFLYIKSSGKK